MIGYLVILAIFIVLSAFFSAAEIAIFSVSHSRLKLAIKKNLPGAKKLEYLKSNPKKTLVTILIGNNIANVAASAIATMLAISFFGNMGTGIATGAMVLILLVFGEVSPKSYAVHHSEPLALKFSPFLVFMMKVLYPIICVFEIIARKITKTEEGMKAPKITEEEIKSMVEMSAEAGNVNPDEKEMIERIFQFNDITVREVMTHRSEMICIEANISLKDAAVIMEYAEFSRYMVYRKSKDNIVGTVHIKDVLFAINKGKGKKQVKSIMAKADFVPQHTTLNDLFKRFQDKQIHMSAVVNDHGEVIGLCTIEDLLEEIVGEIIDESDVRQHMIKRIDKKTVLVHGSTELRALNRFFHTTLPGKQNDSLSKIILKHLRRFPKIGEIITLNNHELVIIDATPKKIIKMRIRKLYED